jgi:predicted TIM-barrel fold metal-dependent hydrolase
MSEAILEPELAIVDPHHHLWDRTPFLPPANEQAPVRHGFENVMRLAPRYLIDELVADMKRGHNVVATVFVQCGSMYRVDGPAHLRVIGETEFVNGAAAMSASGLYGDIRACAGIVSHVDLTQDVKLIDEALQAHVAVGGGRFRGIRHSASYDADPNVLGPLSRQTPGLYPSADFRRGFAAFAKHRLSFDAWLLEPQLGEFLDLVRAFPDTQFILDHVGTPLGIGAYAGKREDRFAGWAAKMREIGACENVAVKLGGLAMPFPGFDSFMQSRPSSVLAEEWRPYIETCIEAFTPKRAMFESNFPVDLCSCTYDVLWNAFKIIAKDASADEKAELFAGAAKRAYRLDL